MRYFSKNRFSLKQVVIMLTIVFLGIGVIAYASSVPTLNIFSAGTTISSSQVNDNFTAVKTAVDDNSARLTALEAPRSIIIPAAAFVPEDETLAYTKWSDATWNGYLSIDTLEGTFYAPLPVPFGHTITRFELLAYDTVDSGYVSAEILKGRGYANTNIVAGVGTSIPENDCMGCVKSLTPVGEFISPDIVNYYRIRVHISSGSTVSNNVGFEAVKVTYQ